MVDGHKSYLTMHISDFCSENGIILYALLPNCTHIIQPADVSVFKPLKSHWKDTIVKWQAKPENINSCLSKITFAPLLAETLENSDLRESIKNGFRTCGLYPFDPDKIDYIKCVQNTRETLATSNDKEVNPVLSSTPDLQQVEAVVHKISPQLKSRGIDVDIIMDEIHKAYYDSALDVTLQHDFQSNEIECGRCRYKNLF